MSDSVAFIRNEDESAARPQAGFTSTLWSVVLAAGEDHGPDPNPALEELCRRYWQPLYAFLRRSGYSIESAQDLTQSFFVHFLKHQGPLSRVDPQKGRFRCYLLACLRNYIRDERRREQAAKRGGTTPVLSFDSSEAEKRYLEDGADHRTPDTLYEKRWALVLLERVLEQLVEESDQPHIVKELRAHIAGDDAAVP